MAGILWGRKKSESPAIPEHTLRPAAVKIEMVCTSHVGLVRENNEDNFWIADVYMLEEHQSLDGDIIFRTYTNQKPLAAVFDGMGGCAHGEAASYEAAAALNFYMSGFDERTHGYSEDFIREMILGMNESVVHRRQQLHNVQMGTTVSLMAFDEQQFWIANVGDSPVYLIRDLSIRMISRPHNNQKMLDEIASKRKAGLTQYLGIPSEEFELTPYIKSEGYKEGDIFLICSDGLTDMVSEMEIMKIMQSQKTLREKMTTLRQHALGNGGKDNITIILCRIGA